MPAHVPERTVQPQERLVVALLTSALFVLLCAYYLLKVAREPLILLGGGPVARSYARGTQALLLLGLVPLYARLTSRIDPRRLVSGMTAAFLVVLLILRALAARGHPIGFAFFVWLGAFSTFAVAQLWSLVNDVLDEESGKRLLPVVGARGTIGAVVGAQLAAQLVGRLTALGLVDVGATLIAGAIVLSLLGAAHAPPARRKKLRPQGGYRLTLTDPYLRRIGGMVLLLNLVNTTGDFFLAGAVTRAAERVAAGPEARARLIGEFYGAFQTAVTVVAAAVQLALAQGLFKTLRLRTALLATPATSLLGYGALATAPALALPLIGGIKVITDGLDYSLQNTTEQALFLPTSREAKYQAKAAIDTLAVRLGDLGSAALVGTGTRLVAGTAPLALATAAFSFAWLLLATALSRRRDVAAARLSPARPTR